MEIRNADAGRRMHAVLIPCPAQGHITPFLQLARKFVANHGFRITFVNTAHIHDRFMKARTSAANEHEGIEFVTVSDGLPEDDPRTKEVTNFSSSMLEMDSVFEALLTNLLKKSSIDCVIRDMFLTAADHAAHKLHIPVVVFGVASAISLHCCSSVHTFIANGILPMPPPPNESMPSIDAATLTIALPQSAAEAAARAAPLTCLPGGSPTMRVEDLPTMLLTHDLENFGIRFFLEQFTSLPPFADCVLLNTSSDLEGVVLDAMRDSLNENVFAVGPLVLDAKNVDMVEEVTTAGVGSLLWEEDRVSLSWLDGQKPSSVLFVSFGSMAMVSLQQMREFAAGLEASKVPFLWIIRADLVEETSENQEFKSMFAEFAKRTENRALLVPWAPQAAVLAHPAVGAFLTHCGWNSILESISSGVPMLGWPRFSDQSTNCHYMTSVWKIGLELRQSRAGDGASIVLKEEIIEKVKKIMGVDDTDEEVTDIRRNCSKQQVAARKTVSMGGSSQAALAQFVEFITIRTKGCPPSNFS